MPEADHQLQTQGPDSIELVAGATLMSMATNADDAPPTAPTATGLKFPSISTSTSPLQNSKTPGPEDGKSVLRHAAPEKHSRFVQAANSSIVLVQNDIVVLNDTHKIAGCTT